MTPTFETLSQWRRSAYCAALTQLNINHIILFSELNEQNPKPAQKLLNKVWSFLEGELKSLDNLERFFNEFDQWQNQLLKELDSFGAMAAQQACQSLYSAAYALLDESANDCELVYKSLQQLLADMEEMGAETEELLQQQQAFDTQLIELLTSGKPKRETIQAVRKLSSQGKASSLGIELD